MSNDPLQTMMMDVPFLEGPVVSYLLVAVFGFWLSMSGQRGMVGRSGAAWAAPLRILRQFFHYRDLWGAIGLLLVFLLAMVSGLYLRRSKKLEPLVLRAVNLIAILVGGWFILQGLSSGAATMRGAFWAVVFAVAGIAAETARRSVSELRLNIPRGHYGLTLSSIAVSVALVVLFFILSAPAVLPALVAIMQDPDLLTAFLGMLLAFWLPVLDWLGSIVISSGDAAEKASARPVRAEQ
jgi:hypothetical protein